VHCTVLLPTARQRPNSRFFRAAMSIAKRIWPAILIDSKFSTKLCHGTGLSPDIFRLKRKIPFEEAASTIQPQ
jgi:hypothetical protein